MNRIATLMDPSGGNKADNVNSELVLGLHLQANDITVQQLPFPMTRIRLTGDIPSIDHRRVRVACKSGADPVACEMVKLNYKFPR
ncbi:unnamed protein product [Ectocarpus fasciculatus]